MAKSGDPTRGGNYVAQQKTKFEQTSSASSNKGNQAAQGGHMGQRDNGRSPDELGDHGSSSDGPSTTRTKMYLLSELFDGDDYYKMCYVFHVKHKQEQLNCVVREHNYEVIKAAGDQFALKVPSDVKNEDLVSENLHFLLRGLSVSKLEYNGDKSSRIKFCLETSDKEPVLRDETVWLFPDSLEDKYIQIVGPRQEFKKAKEYVEMELKNKEKSLKEVHSVSSVVNSSIPVVLDELDMLILKHTSVLLEMKARSTGVTLDFDRERKCINVTGPDQLKKDALKFISSLLEQYKKSYVKRKDPAVYIKLLQKTDVKKYLKSQLEMKDIACYWFCHDKEIHIFSTSKEMSEQCLSIMTGCLKEIQIPMDDSITYILDNECSEFEDKMVFEKDKDKSLIIVASTSDIFEQLRKFLKSKYKDSEMEKREIASDNLNWEFCKDVFREEVESHQEKVYIEYKEDRLVLSGVKSSVMEADQKIRELLSKIQEREIVIYGEEQISTLRKHYKVGETPEKTDVSQVLTHLSDPKSVVDPLKDVEYGNGKKWIFADGRVVVLQLTQWHHCDADVVISFKQETKQEASHLSEKKTFIFDYGAVDDRNVFHLFLPPYEDGRNKETEKLEETMNIILQEMKGKTLRSLGVPLDQVQFVFWKDTRLMKRMLHCFTQQQDFFVSRLYFTHHSKEALQVYRDVIQAALREVALQTDYHSSRQFTVEVKEASLVDAKVDVLVNTTDLQLNLKKGAVSKSVLEKCGEELKEECARQGGKTLKYGEVLITGSGKGKQYGWKNIFHGALPEWTNTENISILVHFVAECLRKASDLGLQSVAFPALGTGQLAYPKSEAARAIMTGILDYRKAYPQKSPRQILLTVFERKDVKVFKDELQSQLKRRKTKDVGGCVSFDIRKLIQLILTQTDIRVHGVNCLLVFWIKDEIYSTDVKGYLKETGKVALSDIREKRSTLLKSHCVTTDKCLPYGRIIHQVIDMSDLTRTVVKGLSEADKHGSRRIGIVISHKDQISPQLENWSCAIYTGAAILAKQQNSLNVREIVISCEDILFSKCIQHISKRHAKAHETVSTSNNIPELSCKIRILGTSEDVVEKKEKQIRAIINQTETEGASYKEKETAAVKDENSKTNVHKDPSNENADPAKRKELVLTEEEKCCLIVNLKMDDLKRLDHLKLKKQLEERLSKYHKFSRFVYPFLDVGKGLLKCDTPDDAKKFLKETTKEDTFTVEAFPPQAVNNIEAKLSKHVQEFLDKLNIRDDYIDENTGASLHKNKTWVLKGNLLEIKAAEKFIQDLIQSPSSSIGERKTEVKNANQSRRSPSSQYEAMNPSSSIGERKMEVKNANQSRRSPSSQDEAMRKCNARCSLEHKECLNHFFPRDWAKKCWCKENKEIDEATFSGDYNVIQELNSCLKEIYGFHRELLADLTFYQIEAAGTILNNLQIKREDVMLKLDKRNKQAVIIGRTKETAVLVRKRITEVLKDTFSSTSSPGGLPQQNTESINITEQEKIDTVFVSKKTFDILKHMKKHLPWEDFQPSERNQVVQLSMPNSMMNSFENAKKDVEALSTDIIILHEHDSIELAKCISHLETEDAGIYIRQESDRITIKGVSDQIVQQTKERIEEVINKKERWEQQGQQGTKSSLYPMKQLADMKLETAGYGSDLPGASQQTKYELQKVKPPKSSKIPIGNGVSAYVYKGDICKLAVDCIVNPTNETLDLIYGVSGCIMQSAGEEVSKVLKKTHKECGHSKLGHVFQTHSGSLNYAKIFHVVCHKWISYFKSDDGIRCCEKDFNVILKEILKSADKGFTSIGIPAIGAGGVGGIPKVLCANSYAKSIQDFFKTKNPKTLCEVHIVDSKEEMVNLIRVAFRSPIPWIFQRCNGDGQISLCNNLKVQIYQGFFASVNAQAVAVSEGEDLTGNRWAVSQLLHYGGNAYQESHKKLKKSAGNRVLVCKGNYEFFFRTVLHVILPIQKNWSTFLAEYRKGIREMLSTADCREVQSLAMPFIGGGSDDPNHQKSCADALAEELLLFSEKTSHLTDIHIVNGDLKDSSKGNKYNELLIGQFRNRIEAKFSSNHNLQKLLTVKEPEVPSQKKQGHQNGAKHDGTLV